MTTPPPQSPPANWYPDPQTPGQLRYWDGQRWTQHTHPVAGAAGGGQASSQQDSNGSAQGALGSQQGGHQGGQQGGYQGSQQGGQTTQPGSGATPTVDGLFGGGAGAGASGAGASSAGASGGSPFGGAFSPGGPAQRPGAANPGAGGQGPGSGATPVVGGTIRPDGAAAPRQSFQPSGHATFEQSSPGHQSGVIRPQVREGELSQGPPSGPIPKPLDEDKIVKDSSGSSSMESRLAAIVGFLAIAFAGVAVVEVIPPNDAYIAAALGLLALTFGVGGVKKVRDGFRGGGRAWFGLIGGFVAVGIATFVYLYPGALAGIVLDLF